MTPRSRHRGPSLALAAAASAAVAAVAVVALTRGADGPAAATVPPDDSVPAAAGDAPERSITVGGRGTVTVVPDVAELFAGVQATEATAEEALDTVATGSQELVATLTGLGIAEEDVQTSGLNLYPQFGGDGTRIDGYQASTSVTVTIRDVESVGTVVDGLQGFVGEELTLGGITFGYDDPEAVLAEARAAAVDNARARAEQYAAAAGAELGELVRIVEGSVPDAIPLARPAAADAALESQVAIEPGTQDLSADVTVVFEMS